MEEASPVKSMVAELAGKLKDHALPSLRNEESCRQPHIWWPTLHEIVKENTKRSNIVKVKKELMTAPNFHKNMKPVIAPQPAPKPKLKNSPLIEKLQANLTLTPTVLLPSTKSPEVKHKAVPFCLVSHCHTQCPTLRPPQEPGADEVPVSFEQPADGTPLPNFNKSRVRLSFKRRPPTRQHRKSAGDEVASDTEANTSPCDQHSVDIEETFSTSLNETKEHLTDPTHPDTEQETEQPKDHKDGIQDNGGNRDNEIDNRVNEEESETVKSLEEKADYESSEEMEGLEEQRESTPTEENGEVKEQTSED